MAYFIVVFVLSAFLISFGVYNDNEDDPYFWSWVCDKIEKRRAKKKNDSDVS